MLMLYLENAVRAVVIKIISSGVPVGGLRENAGHAVVLHDGPVARVNPDGGGKRIGGRRVVLDQSAAHADVVRDVTLDERSGGAEDQNDIAADVFEGVVPDDHAGRREEILPGEGQPEFFDRLLKTGTARRPDNDSAAVDALDVIVRDQNIPKRGPVSDWGGPAAHGDPDGRTEVIIGSPDVMDMASLDMNVLQRGAGER